MTGDRRNWVDRIQILWRIGNRIEALELRRLGTSPMAFFNAGKVLVLETTGRRSGRTRFTPVAYWEEAGGSYMIGGGAAGKTRTPDWVANLRADPVAAVWIRRARIPVVAKELTGEERERAQLHAIGIWRGVPKYARRSGRVIPYFRLTKVA
jgi:deazaflavin-dependent oxidoreductase (nitroreductase family)